VLLIAADHHQFTALAQSRFRANSRRARFRGGSGIDWR
jgi:hypothetical protein